MASFVDIALPLAERGFSVFPLIGGTKQPFRMDGDADHFDAATTDGKQIRLWDVQVPTANVGIAPDEIFCFLETDDEAALKDACSYIDPEVWDTARVSARLNRCYYIFRQTSRTRRAGNMTAKRPGQDNLFEFKQHRVYVTGPGSIHPKTKAPYDVEWFARIPAMPDVLLDRLCELYGKPKATAKPEQSSVVRQSCDEMETWCANNRVAMTGEWFVDSARKLWLHPVVCPWAAAHENLNAGTSTCVFVVDAGANAPWGFRCEHRCGKMAWADFKAKLGVVPTTAVVIGADVADVGDVAALPETPRYPIEAWDDTVVAEFARLCSEDNNVPRSLYAEAFRCVLGAVLGDRLVCPDVEGANPRSFTTIIAPFGKGKGTSISRAVDFFSVGVGGEGPLSPFLSGNPLFPWKPYGIGALRAAASSVPGMARLLKEPKDIKQKPHLAWRETLPRILSVHEEMKVILGALFIEGGTGSALGGVLCQLWDRPEFSGTATGTRDAQHGEMLFSMLCGVTPSDWDDLLSHGDVIGGGLYSRLNIVSTDGGFEDVATMTPPDFNAMRETFLPRIQQLQDAHARVRSSDAARSIMGEWVKTLPQGSQRMNIHAWRTALLLAWLRREDAISERTANNAVVLGRFQVIEHDRFRPQQADNAFARVQNQIRSVLKRHTTLAKGRLRDHTNANRIGTELWNRALEGLIREGIVKLDERRYTLA